MQGVVLYHAGIDPLYPGQTPPAPAHGGATHGHLPARSFRKPGTFVIVAFAIILWVVPFQ